MKAVFFLSFFLQISMAFSQKGEYGIWTFYEDPMGEDSYAICKSEGYMLEDITYRKKRSGEWYFRFEEQTIYKELGMGSENPDNFKKIIVKFKIGSEIVNLEDALKAKYPKYKGLSLSVYRQYGSFWMTGFNSNYLPVAETGIDIDVEMRELWMKASVVSMEFGGHKSIYPTAGFKESIAKCK